MHDEAGFQHQPYVPLHSYKQSQEHTEKAVCSVYVLLFRSWHPLGETEDGEFFGNVYGMNRRCDGSSRFWQLYGQTFQAVLMAFFGRADAAE